MIVDNTAHDAPGRTGRNPGREPESNWPDAMSWRDASECRTHPTHWWFAGGHRETATAKRICADCGVKASCLEFALSRPELLGVWAATTPVERANIRRGETQPAVEIVLPGATGVAPTEVETAAEVRLAGIRRKLARDAIVEPGSRPRSRADGPGRVDAAVERDELLTPAEAARKLGVTPNTVTRWSRSGKISAIQTMGGHRRFRRSEIERVLRDGSTVASRPIAL